jgi:hypothetical protein
MRTETDLPEGPACAPATHERLVICGRCEGGGDITYRDRTDKVYVDPCPLCGGGGIVVIEVMA